MTGMVKPKLDNAYFSRPNLNFSVEFSKGITEQQPISSSEYNSQTFGMIAMPKNYKNKYNYRMNNFLL